MSTAQSTHAPSPFLFILNQLEAAEQAAKEAQVEPPKRPRGRPPKEEPEPLAPGAYRHVLSDEDSEHDKQLMRLEKKLERVESAPVTVRQVPVRTGDGKLAIIVPTGDKFTCVIDKQVFGVSKYPDYWEHHYAKGDLRKASDVNILKFVRVTELGVVDSLSSAELLRTVGQKGAKLNAITLQPSELTVIQEALTALAV